MKGVKNAARTCRDRSCICPMINNEKGKNNGKYV